MNGKTLTEVLEGYALETQDGNDQSVLRRWMDENPEFADDLMDFAASRALVRHIDDDLTADEAERYRELGSSVLESVLQGSGDPVPESLAAVALAKGWKKAEFAKRLGISVSLAMYLEKRRLRFATIPLTMIRRIAETLELTERAVRSYLQMPAVAGEASFKAATRPEEVKQKSFADAVNEDQTLSLPEKQELLKMK